MSEVEVNMFCENCGSTCRLIYEREEANYEPENCPFCGEPIGTLSSEDFDIEEVDYDEDEDEDNSWD